MEHKGIVIDERGVSANGYTGSEILAMLIEAVCQVWHKECGKINIQDAGRKLIDTLAAAETEYMVRRLFYEKLNEEDEEDE